MGAKLMWDVNDENENNLEKRDKFIDDIFEIAFGDTMLKAELLEEHNYQEVTNKIMEYSDNALKWEQQDKITIPSETWVELYSTLSNHILEYSALDSVWTEDENGGEVYTEDAQNKFMDISEQVEDILSGFFIKEQN